MRTHTITLGSETIALRVPLTARQRTEVCAEWWSASESFDALLRATQADAPLSLTALAQAEQDVQAGVGAALSRLAPEDHPWRERVRRYAGEGHPSPALAAGLDLVDELAALDVSPVTLAQALGEVLAAAAPAPTQRQVEAAQGNSPATPS